MKPEQYFFRYSYPCSQYLVMLKKITEKQKKDLDKKFLNNQCPSRKVLENYYSAAFERIKKVAKAMKREPWDINVIREYFIKEHNMCIARNEGNYKLFPKSMKDICKVYIGEVIERKGNILTLKLNGKKKTIKKFLDNSLNAKKGDKVTVHYGFAIEKI
jgi:hypothetical protein